MAGRAWRRPRRTACTTTTSSCFALSKTLGFRPDTSLEHLVEALKGTTIAKGELIGLFENPDLPAGS